MSYTSVVTAWALTEAGMLRCCLTNEKGWMFEKRFIHLIWICSQHWHLHLFYYYIQCLAKKKTFTHTNIFWLPFALTTVHTGCGIVFTILHSVTTFISSQSCINVSPSNPIQQSTCENVSSCSLNHSFATWAWWILALLSWNIPVPSVRKISIDGKTWPFSTFR